MIDLKKFLKFRLPKWKNKEFIGWTFDNKKQGEEVHHLILKQNNDLFLVNIKANTHKKIHLHGYDDGQFEDLFIEALKNIQKYIDEKSK